MSDKTPAAERKPQDYLISYKMLRRTVGWFGLALSPMLILGDLFIFRQPVVRESISAYYWSDMGDVFVGILFAIAVFMFAYRGPKLIDGIAGGIACIFAVGVALFPTTRLADDVSKWEVAIGTVHVICASGLFSTLAFFCLFLFTKTKSGETPKPEKKFRNKIYYVCGGIMVACILSIAVEMFLPIELRNHLFLTYRGPIFWPETLAIIAFGVSWLVKGEQIFADHD